MHLFASALRRSAGVLSQLPSLRPRIINGAIRLGQTGTQLEKAQRLPGVEQMHQAVQNYKDGK